MVDKGLRSTVWCATYSFSTCYPPPLPPPPAHSISFRVLEATRRSTHARSLSQRSGCVRRSEDAQLNHLGTEHQFPIAMCARRHVVQEDIDAIQRKPNCIELVLSPLYEVPRGWFASAVGAVGCGGATKRAH